MILETLAGMGLTKLYHVVKDKGLDVVKDKLGIDVGALIAKGEEGAASIVVQEQNYTDNKDTVRRAGIELKF